MGMNLLCQYCNGTRDFPTATLKGSHVSERGVIFVKSLMAANPASRISASDALKSSWLLEIKWQVGSETLRSQLRSLGLRITLETANYLIEQIDAKADIMKIHPFLTRANFEAIYHIAASNRYLMAVKTLIRAIHDIDCRVDGLTALQTAARNGHADIAEIHIGAGAKVNAAPVDSNHIHTALQLAASGGHLKMVELRLEKGANANDMPYAVDDRPP